MAYTHAHHMAVPVTRLIYEILVSFPVACFTLVLITDIAYWQTSYLMWQDFSSWLLFAGLVSGCLAWLAGLIDRLVGATPLVRGSTWLDALLGLVVVGLAFVNSLVHAADGWIAVVPYGLVLSVATVALMCVMGLLSRRMVLRSDGVRSHG